MSATNLVTKWKNNGLEKKKKNVLSPLLASNYLFSHPPPPLTPKEKQGKLSF
jgi:hypothetical protein